MPTVEQVEAQTLDGLKAELAVASVENIGWDGLHPITRQRLLAALEQVVVGQGAHAVDCCDRECPCYHRGLED